MTHVQQEALEVDVRAFASVKTALLVTMLLVHAHALSVTLEVCKY